MKAKLGKLPTAARKFRPVYRLLASNATALIYMAQQSCYVLHRMPSSLLNSKLECGPMPNLMVALPNIGGALCSMPQSLADAHN